MVQNLMVQAEEFSQVQHLRWGLTEKEINKKTHDKRKKDGARQIYKVVFLRQGVGGEPRVFQSLFCFNHYQFHHPGTLGVPYTTSRSYKYFVC